jgi:hypothetical protein
VIRKGPICRLGPDDPKAAEVLPTEGGRALACSPEPRYALAIVRHDLNRLIGSVEPQITSLEDGCGVLGYRPQPP